MPQPMESINREEIETLAAQSDPLSISIFMPSHRGGPEAQQDQIRVKVLIREVTEQALQTGHAGGEIRKRLDPLDELRHDSDFWRHQNNGLAVFINGDGMRVYRVPLDLDQFVVVAERFHIKPLLPLVSAGGTFHLLTLGQASVRLFRTNAYDMAEVPLPDAPSNLEEITQYNVDEEHIQYHSGTGQGGPGQRRAAVYHGQGVGSDEAGIKRRLIEYCHLIEKAVTPRLQVVGGPLLLAAADPLLGLYREANSYADLHEELLHGNYEHTPAQELHRLAIEKMASQFERCLDQAVARCEQAAGKELGSGDLGEIIAAAGDGRVDTLLVAEGEHAWGAYDADNRRVSAVHESQQPGDEDLLDLAASRAIQSGAGVYAAKRRRIPGGGAAAAVYRYPAPSQA